MIFSLAFSVSSTPSCSFGEFDAWISVDGTNWMNTTVKNLLLECGQPFLVKAQIRPTIDDIWVAVHLFEPGTGTKNDESFLVLDGPCKLNSYADLGRTQKNETIIIIWELQVKDHPSWVGGSTPLSITVFFQKQQQDTWLTEDITFSVANIHLQETIWNDTTSIDTSELDPIQSKSQEYKFLFIPVILIFVLFISWKKKNEPYQ